MADISDLTPDLDQLDVDIDELEEALKPILDDLGGLSSHLPLLDKSKLYVLATYAIESLLFSTLRISGVSAREHPVSTELVRIRQYFEKIKKIETPPETRENSLNKQAAIRFLKADLADNTEVSQKLGEQLIKEREKAASKTDKKRPADSAESSTRESKKGSKRSKSNRSGNK